MANRQDNNSTNYKHPEESNLYDLHKAMEYDGAGRPVLRVHDNGAATHTAFGEPVAVPITPLVQTDAIYGLDKHDHETFTGVNGTVTTDSSQFLVSTGIGVQNSYAVLRTKRFIRYRPGQGSMCRFAARWSKPGTQTILRAGFMNQENELAIGYLGPDFGIHHVYGGRAHIERLTVTTPPDTNQTLSIVLNGVIHQVALVDGETAQQTAARIARVGSFPDWTVNAYDNTVVFLSNGTLQELTETFGWSSTGNVVVTLETTRQGHTGTTNFIPQSQWNRDPLDGTGSSGIVLDPQSFNVFQINFRWLGAGIIQFALENPITGQMVLIHTIHWTNKNDNLHLENPSMKIGAIAYHFGETVEDPGVVYLGSIMGAIEGIAVPANTPNGAFTTKTSLSADTYHHLGTLENPVIANNAINTRPYYLESLSVAYTGQDVLNVLLYKDVPLATGTHLFSSYPGIDAKASLVTGTVDITQDSPEAAYVLPINGSTIFDLSKIGMRVEPGERFTVAVFSGGNISEVSATVNWIRQ